MSFPDAIRKVLSHYATFQGRARRSEFWWWMLFLFLVNLAVGAADVLAIHPLMGFEPGDPEAGHPLGFLVMLALLLPTFAVGVRRIHDIDRSGWWVLIWLVPVVGTLVMIWFGVQKGTEGPNRFGPPPA